VIARITTRRGGGRRPGFAKLDRRAFLLGTGALAAGVAVGSLVGNTSIPAGALERVTAAGGPCGSFRIGLSVSPFSEGLMERGVSFADGKKTARTPMQLQRLWMEHGGSEIFVRLGTALAADAQSSRSGLDTRVELAKRLDLPLNPELLLCGQYGDISRQPPPDFTGYRKITVPDGKRWSQLTIDEMTDVLRTYGTIEARGILDRGVEVNVWDIGNEVEYGLAGVAIRPSPAAPGYEPPDAVNPRIGTQSQMGGFFGDLEWLKNELWPYVAQMLAAVADGIRVADPKAVVATHCSTISAFVPGFLTGFHQAMADGGFDGDFLGTSWYPGASPVADQAYVVFKEEVARTRKLVGKPIYVAEYAYAAGPATFNGADWSHPVSGYPVSPAGQADLLRDLTEWGANTGNIGGIRPWAPDLVEGGWAGLAMFDLSGSTASVRPSVASMQDGLRRAGKAQRNC
jgi:hypothetical protein